MPLSVETPKATWQSDSIVLEAIRWSDQVIIDAWGRKYYLGSQQAE